MIDREQFYYLLVHANSLAELGLRYAVGMADDAAVEATPSGDPAELSPMAGLEELDFGALEGLDLDGGGEPDPVTAEPDPGWLFSAGPKPVTGEQSKDVSYLDRAYAQGDRVRPRADAAFRGADLRELERLLAACPPDLPAITARLDHSGLDAWLDQYKAGNSAVSEVVLRIRQLET